MTAKRSGTKVKPSKATKKWVLRANRPLLYDGLTIMTGEEISFRDDKVNAWLKDGSAEWYEV